MKKTKLIIVIIMIALVGNVMAETTMNFLTKGFADTLYCALTGCTMEGDINMGGNSIVHVNWVNTTYTNITINYTQLSDEHWVNESGDTMSGNLTIDTGVNSNPTLKFDENLLGNGFEITSKHFSTNYLEFNAMNVGVSTTRFKIRRLEPEIESYSSIDFQNDYNITNLDCLEFNNKFVCDWDDVNGTFDASTLMVNSSNLSCSFNYESYSWSCYFNGTIATGTGDFSGEDFINSSMLDNSTIARNATITALNNSLVNYIFTTNASLYYSIGFVNDSMKDYVDTVNDSMVSWVSDVNGTMKIYVDSVAGGDFSNEDFYNGSQVNDSIAEHNKSMIVWVAEVNSTMKIYVDTRDSELRTNIDDNATLLSGRIDGLNDTKLNITDQRYNDTSFILWENSTGETKLKSPQDINMQENNINNVSNVSMNGTLNINEVIINSVSTNNLWENVFHTDNPVEPLNNLIAVIESNGTTGVHMPHFWIQGGGPEQASGVSRSFMIVNEVVALQNTTNITSCTAVQDSMGIPSEHRIDCNTTETGADLLVSDDILVGGDISITDTTGEYGSLNRLVQVIEEFFNNVLFNRINTSIIDGYLNITDTFNETLILSLNAFSTNLQVKSDKVALNTGTTTSPAFNFISYQNQDNPVLTVDSTTPADTVNHADVLRAYIGADVSEVYLFEDTTSHGFSALNHIYDRFDDAGAIYKSGLGITSSATEINITTGSVRLRIAKTDYINNVSSGSDYYFVNSTGNFINSSGNNLLHFYSNDVIISNNKYFNIIWGVVPINGSNMRLVAVVQDEPSTEYGSLADAEADKFGTINFFPNNDNLKKVFVPVARTIIKEAGSDDFELLPGGLFHFDIRGQVTAAGGSAAAPPITNHDELNNLDYASAGHTGFQQQLENSSNITIEGGNIYFNGTITTDPSALDIVNQSMLDNTTIIRDHNTSWIIDNQNTVLNDSIEITESQISDLQKYIINGSDINMSKTHVDTLEVYGDSTVNNLTTKYIFSKRTFDEPTGGLDSNVNIWATNTDGFAGIGILAKNDTRSFIHFGDTNDSNAGAIDYNHVNDRFEIKTAGSTLVLRLDQNIELLRTGADPFIFTNVVGSGIKYRVGSGGTHQFLDSGNAVEFAVYSDGSIFAPSMSTLSPGVTVSWKSVTGEIIQESSSIRFKENIREIPDVSWIHNLSIHIYDWIGERKNILGLIAEEVAEIDPTKVTYEYRTIYGDVIDDEGQKEILGYEKTGNISSVRYNEVYIAMLKEVQNLRIEVDTLQAEIAQLKEDIKS